MKYSKILAVLGFLTASNAIPVPLFEDLDIFGTSNFDLDHTHDDYDFAPSFGHSGKLFDNMDSFDGYSSGFGNAEGNDDFDSFGDDLDSFGDDSFGSAGSLGGSLGGSFGDDDFGSIEKPVDLDDDLDAPSTPSTPSVGGKPVGPSAGPSMGGKPTGPSAGPSLGGDKPAGPSAGPSMGGKPTGPSAGPSSGPSVVLPEDDAEGLDDDLDVPSLGGKPTGSSGPAAGVNGPSMGGDKPSGPSAGPSMGGKPNGPSLGGDKPSGPSAGPSMGGKPTGPSAGPSSGPSVDLPEDDAEGLDGDLDIPSLGGKPTGPSGPAAGVNGPSTGKPNGPSLGGDKPTGPSAGSSSGPSLGGDKPTGPSAGSSSGPSIGGGKGGLDITTLPDSADVITVVTEGISTLIKSTLCEALNKSNNAGAGNLCDQISSTVINGVTGVLKNVLNGVINTASGNTLTIACSVIPSNLFKNLSTVIVGGITNEIGKNGGDAENSKLIANKIINVIINSVQNLLCNGKQTGDLGNVGDLFINNINDFINKINNKAKFMNENVSAVLLNEKQATSAAHSNIASGIADVQDAIKMEYKKQYIAKYNKSY